MADLIRTDQEFFILASILMGLGFVLYWVLGNSGQVIRSFGGGPKGSISEVVIRRFIGFFIMGVFPLTIAVTLGHASMQDLGLEFQYTQKFTNWLIGLGIPSILINWAAGNNAENNSVYPQIRIKEWSVRTFIIEYSTWAFYLVGYEFLFRGLFLFASLQVMSQTAAIALNVVVYSLAHLPKGNKETLGSVILGTLMCLAVIHTGSMWIAFIVHVIMAWSNSIFSFRLNKEFSYAGK